MMTQNQRLDGQNYPPTSRVNSLKKLDFENLNPDWTLASYDFHLPPHLIAQHPASEENSRN